jgi:peptidoglycan LD-endopeptidase LytH
MTRAREWRALLPLALFVGFCAGVIVDGWARTPRPPQPVQSAVARSREPVVAAEPPADDRLPPAAEQPTIAAAPVATIEAVSTTRLRVPIDGIRVESFRGGFFERRGSRQHEGVDILAPRGTPVHAVAGGTIAKLFFSRFGGTTIYEFEDDGRLCFYYAHLQGYAVGLHDGQHVSQDEVIGYVGTSGNAPIGTPHLHFEVSELDRDRKWWRGRPIDPYLVFKQRGED